MIHHRQKPILYVDDTVEQRYAMRRILENAGYTVIEAGSAQTALALLETSPSLAVVDVRLPDMDGYELTRHIKLRQPYLPVLQVSASFSDPDLRASGFSGGADAYIAQPVHPSELTAVIRRILQTAEAEESLRFLARIGSRLGASLSLPQACENIRSAMVPHFADRCMIYIKDFPGIEGELWAPEAFDADEDRELVREQAASTSTVLLNNRLIIAPLFLGDANHGAIAFFLDDDREYTVTDQILAADLANRTAMVLQNCKLFAREQAARAALIQAEKLATAGRMAAAIAHEVNNPLEALTNLMYLLERSTEVSESTRDIASIALGEVTRLAHITRQTLGFYRELKAPTTMNLSESIAETVELYRRRISEKDIQVRFDLEEKLLIRGIKGEIRQVISNLLVNAFEAMDHGGTVLIRARSEQETAVTVISDDGPGIPKAILPRIFEPFYTTKAGTGTGLGLWIAQNIVEKHQGKLSVSSDTSSSHHGTEFTLSIPLLEAA